MRCMKGCRTVLSSACGASSLTGGTRQRLGREQGNELYCGNEHKPRDGAWAAGSDGGEAWIRGETRTCAASLAVPRRVNADMSDT